MQDDCTGVLLLCVNLKKRNSMITLSSILFYCILAFVALLTSGLIYGLFSFKTRLHTVSFTKAELEKQCLRLQESSHEQASELREVQEKREQAEKELAVVNAQNTDLRKQYELHKADQQVLEQRFENLANRVLQTKSTQFDEQQRKSLTDLLDPLKERLQHFESKVELSNKEAIARSAALKQQIGMLAEMGDRMSQETTNLTKALKGDVKQQGNWGEMILESILERSGLVKGREYAVQPTLLDHNQRHQRPDVIIRTPDGKVLIIDSKVSLKSYEQSVNAQNEQDRKRSLRSHVHSLRKHVDTLAGKAYHELYEEECPDFVFMFIPLNQALSLALTEDGELHSYAFDKNVVLVTPGSLLGSLKTVESLWKNEKQRQHALEIATEAGKMYDKFVTFCEDLQEVGKRMEQTTKAYDKAMNKLQEGRGNLLSRAEKLRAMGAKANKTLPLAFQQVDQDKNEAA